jgi:hypothetical protein
MYNLFCICASRVSRKGRGGFPCLVAILLFASCQSYKKVPYLQDAKVRIRQHIYMIRMFSISDFFYQ